MWSTRLRKGGCAAAAATARWTTLTAWGTHASPWRVGVGVGAGAGAGTGPRYASPLPLLLLTRTLRTGRGTRGLRRRAGGVALENEGRGEGDSLTKRSTALQRQLPQAATRAPRPLPAVPSYIRVRDLAKLLKQPVESVLKKVVTRRDRRFHMTLGRDKFEFKNVKQIILPFRVAEQVASEFGVAVSYDDVEPALHIAAGQRRASAAQTMQRDPVIAVMGHVDHGKTTLMDTLRGSAIAMREAHSITQKINICEAALAPELRATFLDTPGHFHFFRMRSSAAQVADLVVLVVAADEGCLLQTEESVGAIEETGIPVIACINKIDSASRARIDQVRGEIRSFVALQSCPIVEISATTGDNLEELKAQVAQLVQTPALQRRLRAHVGPNVPAQGIMLESKVIKGRGTVLRVLLQAGVLKKQDHFVAGMIHGVVRSVRSADSGQELEHAVPGMVVDVMFANKSKTVDAPIEFGFFVLPEARARVVIEQRQLALDFAENVLPSDDSAQDEGVEDEAVDAEVATATPQSSEAFVDEEEDNNSTRERSLVKSIIVKADGAGSLASIQDTVDEMRGVNTVRIGIGHVTVSDIDVAIDRHCPIFGFKVKLRRREEKLARARGVRVVLRSTIHGLIDEIARIQGTE